MTASSNSAKKSPFPSTIDDIPSAGIQRHPLSSEELHDIRSLIGVAKDSRDDAVRKDRNVVGASSPRPLAGRRVMVPITSKAFFEGTLQPQSPTKPTDSAKDDAVMGERIIINDGGKLIEMTRAEAADVFDRQHKLATAKKSASSATKSKSAPKKPAIKSSKISSRKADNTSKNAASTDKETPETLANPALPFMEIRETCDVSGNIINSEVVNMSNTMKRLGDGLKNVTEGEDPDEDGKHLGELLAKTLKAGEDDIIKDAHTSHTDNGDLETENDDTKEIPRRKPKTISDSEYEAMCSRLEELERLEEEDEKSKKLNAKSSKRLQSSGWSKGFLNNTKKKSAPRTTKKVSPASTKMGVKTPPASETSASEKQPRVSFTGASEIKDKPKPNATSRVSFSGDNEIKEIPRIGQLKVPPRPSPGRPVSFTPEEVPDVDPFSPIETIPFEENVFRGVVKERTNDNASKSDSARESREVKETAATATNGDDGMGGKKKLSRFAQRRLERER